MPLDLNIPKIVLDPANEGDLMQLTYNRIQAASGNLINDFRPGSSAAAFVEGQTFALMELLYYVNLMPEAIAVEVFRLYGVTRGLGSKASGSLTFLLESNAVDTYILPSGYPINYLDTTIVLQESLVVPVGASSATVACRVDSEGSRYNASPFDIVIGDTGLGLVKSIYNVTPFTGGSDIEPLTSLVKRCQDATVARAAIITQLDYQVAAEQFLGLGSRAIVVPNLGSDAVSFRQASVAVFLLDSTGVPASSATCSNVRASLDERILIGTAINCFPAVLIPIDIEIQINVLTISQEVADSVIQNVGEYLRPSTYDGGEVVQHTEILFQARLAEGVRSVDSVLLNGDAIDVQLAQPFHFPSPRFITVNQIDRLGLTLSTQVLFSEINFEVPI
jgi:uncharacterized phage protein gp47/JayE